MSLASASLKEAHWKYRLHSYFNGLLRGGEQEMRDTIVSEDHIAPYCIAVPPTEIRDMSLELPEQSK